MVLGGVVGLVIIIGVISVVVLVVPGPHANASSSGLCSNYSTADEIAHGRSLAHQVAIVTGGDSGLGYETAKTLAKHGATVVIASHNLAKCHEASRNITAAVGGNVVGMMLDLGSFASVRNFTAQFLKDYTVLNYLINNAGINHAGLSDKTEDGFEEIFQINYLGHFLLTELLLPILRNNRGFSPARIVNTASYVYDWTCITLNVSDGCLKDWTFFPPPISSGPRILPNTYGLSKLALIEHAAELSVREARNDIQAFSVAPGFVNTPINWRNETWACTATQEQTPCPYTPEQGAAVIAACALTATQAGGFFSRKSGCSEDLVRPHGFTMAMRPELYDRSLQWVGLTSSTKTLLA